MLDDRHGSREACRLPGPSTATTERTGETGATTTTRGDSSDLPVLQTEDNMRETVV